MISELQLPLNKGLALYTDDLFVSSTSICKE